MAGQTAIGTQANGAALVQRAAAVPRIGLRPHPALPWLVLPDGVPAQVLDDTALVKVPNVRPWFRGVVSQRGNLLPVFDLAEWGGRGKTINDGRRPPIMVMVGTGAEVFALMSTDLPSLVRAEHIESPSDDTQDLGPLADYLGIPWRIAPGTTDTGYAYPFDLRRWLHDIAPRITGTG